VQRIILIKSNAKEFCTVSQILASRLKFIRRVRGVTQQTIADALGISRAAYSAYETSTAEPDVDLIRKLAQYYHVSVDFLLQIDMQTEDPELDGLRAMLWEHIARADKETAQMILQLFSKMKT
jgi:transcriptional regulator with XRE-family HTH domain